MAIREVSARIGETVVAMNEGGTGGEPGEALRALNINVAELAKMAPEKQLRTILTSLSNVGNESIRSALANQLLSDQYAEMLPLLSRVAENYDDIARNAIESGRLVTTEQANQSIEFQKHWDRFLGHFEGAMQQVVSDMLPKLQELIDLIPIEVVVTAVTTAAKATINTFIAFVKGIKKTVEWVTTVTGVRDSRGKLSALDRSRQTLQRGWWVFINATKGWRSTWSNFLTAMGNDSNHQHLRIQRHIGNTESVANTKYDRIQLATRDFNKSLTTLADGSNEEFLRIQEHFKNTGNVSNEQFLRMQTHLANTTTKQGFFKSQWKETVNAIRGIGRDLVSYQIETMGNMLTVVGGGMNLIQGVMVGDMEQAEAGIALVWEGIANQALNSVETVGKIIHRLGGWVIGTVGRMIIGIRDALQSVKVLGIPAIGDWEVSALTTAGENLLATEKLAQWQADTGHDPVSTGISKIPGLTDGRFTFGQEKYDEWVALISAAVRGESPEGTQSLLLTIG